MNLCGRGEQKRRRFVARAARRSLGGEQPLRRHQPRGVTLVEVLVSTVLVSTVLLVSITASANLLRNQAQQFSAAESVEVLGRLLDEVSSAEFRDPDGGSTYGPEADETSRASFDDMDDYHEYQMSPPVYRDGSVIEGFEAWSAEISVARAEPDGDGVKPVSGDDAPLREITVTLTDANGKRWERSVWAAAVPVDVPPETAYWRMQHIELRFPDEPDVRLTVPLRNRPEPVAN